MILAHIVAASKNRVIGIKNDLPWNIPEDFKYFKEKTKHHPIIMGRLTYESLNKKPLPDRVNIVVSKSIDEAPGFLVYPTIEEAISQAAKIAEGEETEIFIIGGGEIYKQTLDQVQRIYYTLVDREIEGGEAFYPEIPTDQFKLVEEDPREGFTFQVWERK